MKVIWKYPLPAAVTEVEMPIGAELLGVQVQDRVACLWALVTCPLCHKWIWLCKGH